MKTNIIHFHFCPTEFCNQNCPYCINSKKEFIEVSLSEYKKFIELLKKLSESFEIILEFNGGEFTLSKNLNDYFSILKENINDINLKYLIFTTNFNQDNKIYQTILDLFSNKKFNLQFFVTFHYDRNKKFIQKINDFLIKNQDKKFEFLLNKIIGLPLIESNFQKYEEDINKLKEFSQFKIIESKYIKKSLILQGKTQYKTNLKICEPLIFYFYEGNLKDACRDKNLDLNINDFIKYINNCKKIICSKSCPNQKFSEYIFKPKEIKNK